MSLRRILLLAAALLAGNAAAQRLPFAGGDDNFSPLALVKGVAASAEQCGQVREAVWASLPGGEAECLRYWAAGLRPGQPAPRVLVYLPGDQMARELAVPGYAERNPRAMQASADEMHARSGVPVILLSRPGIFGSSGEHMQRRREPEPRLVSAALDRIKARHAIDELVLVGLSGGGHTVAALLGWRDDVVCAVPASAVSSPRLRWQTLGQDRDFTGHADSYEPVAQLKRGAFHPGLRVFVLGDPRDSNVPWTTQLPLAERLRALGVAVELVEGQAPDPQRHGLGRSALALGAMCLRDRATPDILEHAARALRG